MRGTPETIHIDTIVIPAREDGFERVFLGEQRWYALRLSSTMRNRIQFIAVYRVAPISAITHIAQVRSIDPWKKTRKYVISFYAGAEEIGPIKVALGGRIRPIQSLRYTSRAILESAKTLDDVWTPTEKNSSASGPSN